ncbi:MAG TPA: putative oxidoreductase C-terminal domain-containing protein [Pedobacter sp.]|uniref:putative oxidoreductase C-terminal domain-containing protein n=1 Tax=Pedobacter sp. TaxID=1411316 RepID=UPI002BE9B191|nr:putative oxidoreductase C-terminal domain-containing protein [Pedobacter sp.]HMI05374.1 putative oxidoreductase C-terminal domain-containing protein [Pedobacter sp.]
MKSKLLILSLLALAGCKDTQDEKNANQMIKLITLDPGHFHAALVQKSMYPGVDSVVHVYAPEGEELTSHLEMIAQYNSRPDDPTKWKEEVYRGGDYFEKMLADKAGNAVVLAGNNQKKTDYIKRSVDAGLNVLADKPMVIDAAAFEVLKQAFQSAAAKKVVLYDIMTERYEISTMLQRELSMIPEIFGALEKGSPDNPAVTKESVHHFYKFVSGNPLKRPAWFMDVSQEGEGIVDVTTHLVDLVQWECFPEQIIDYQKEIQVNSAKRSSTEMTLSQFTAITKLNSFPDYLKKDIIKDSVLNVFSNGEINYTLRGVHAKVSVKWAYKAPEGTGDTHYSIMRGTKANLIIKQGAEQQYKPALYIEQAGKADAAYEAILTAKFKSVQDKFPGVTLKKLAKGWEVVIPEKYKEGHEAHFAHVTEKFLEYVKKGDMPAWEVPNMIAKYYTTTKGLELARK